jgi:hypothetical protein
MATGLLCKNFSRRIGEFSHFDQQIKPDAKIFITLIAECPYYSHLNTKLAQEKAKANHD